MTEFNSYWALSRKTDYGYETRFPDLPGLASSGRTLDEAERNAARCLYEWLDEWMAEDGETPKPSEFIKVPYGYIGTRISPISPKERTMAGVMEEFISEGVTIKKYGSILNKPDETELLTAIAEIWESLKDVPRNRMTGDKAQIFFWGIIGKVEELCRDKTDELSKLIGEWQGEVGEEPNYYSLVVSPTDGTGLYFFADRQREMEDDALEDDEVKVSDINVHNSPMCISYAVKRLYQIEIKIGAHSYKTNTDDVCLVAFNFGNKRYVVTSAD